MKLSIISFILLYFAKRLVCIEIAGINRDKHCEDQCADGFKCLTNEWLVCKWRQLSDRSIVCCLNRRTNDKSVKNSMQTSGHYQQMNCANSRRLSKRSFLQLFNNLFAPNVRPKPVVADTRTHYPWMVSVQEFEGHICGGAIITDHIVVTAAHCFRPLFDSSVYSLRIGSNRLSDGQKISVSRIIRHELYFQSESYHDIAIIVTESAIKFDKTVNIICIPASDITVDQLVGRWSTVLGFGNVDYGGDLSQALKQIKVQIIDTKDCADRYAIGDKHNIPIGIQECMICGNPGGSSDACQGDSGGPMSITLNGVHHLIGIVSFGRKCGTVRIPGVYTNVIYYRKWIFGQIRRIGT